MQVHAGAGEFAAEFQVLPVGLLERGPKGRGLVSALFLEVRDLAGQRLDDRVVAAGSFRRGRVRAGLGAGPFRSPRGGGGSAEEGVGDAA